MFNLRPARPSDFPAIRSLIRQVGINPLGLHWQRFIVAVNERDELIGCGQIKPHGDGSRELASIAVQPSWRRKGVASAIITRLIDQEQESAREHSPRELYLTCRAQLGEFYQQFGFQAIGPEEMPPYFRRIHRLVKVFQRLGGPDEGLLVMKREL